MKILVTGASGLLGANISYLLSKKHNIIATDRNKINIPSVKLEIFDLKNIKKIENILKIHQPDVLIHCAASTNVDWCETNHKEANFINKEITETISDITSNINIKMVYISTDAVFDGTKTGLYNESAQPNPLNVYASTKLAGERTVLKNPNNLVIRTNFYGFNIRNKQSFSEWILYSLLENKTLNMFDDVYFSPLLVNDLIEIIEKLINHNAQGLYHVSSNNSISKYKFGIELKKVLNITKGKINKISVDEATLIAKRSKNMGLDGSKVAKTLKINLPNVLTGIKHFKNLYDNNYHTIIKKLKS